VTYSQYEEDEILLDVFLGVREGSYVDVGAGHPVTDSVTYLLYERGWHGICIEPQSGLWKALKKIRPRDLSLNIAASDYAGEARLTSYPGSWGWATISDTTVGLHGDVPTVVDKVATYTLDYILDTYWKSGVIHVMSIDVEGSELAVLRGLDLKKYRPQMIVIESVRPGTFDPCHHEWEYLLTSNGYLFKEATPVNRFYVDSRVLVGVDNG